MIFRIIISILFLTLSYAKPLKCNEKTYVRLNDYIIKRKVFVKDNFCLTNDSVIVNKKTNQRVDLLGFVVGLRYIILDTEVLMVRTLAGAHTHIVYFFRIKKDGKLSLIENGDIGSDIGEPKVSYNYFNGDLTVATYYNYDLKCNYLVEDI